MFLIQGIILLSLGNIEGPRKRGQVIRTQLFWESALVQSDLGPSCLDGRGLTLNPNLRDSSGICLLLGRRLNVWTR